MKLWIVKIEDDLSPVQVGEEGLKCLDKHSNVPGRGRFTSKVGRVTAHTTLKERERVCVCVCVHACMGALGCACAFEYVCVCYFSP